MIEIFCKHRWPNWSLGGYSKDDQRKWKECDFCRTKWWEDQAEEPKTVISYFDDSKT